MQKWPYPGQETSEYFPIHSPWHWQYCTEIQLGAPATGKTGKLKLHPGRSSKSTFFFSRWRKFKKEISVPYLITVFDSALFHTAIQGMRGEVCPALTTLQEGKISFQAVETPGCVPKTPTELPGLCLCQANTRLRQGEVVPQALL